MLVLYQLNSALYKLFSLQISIWGSLTEIIYIIYLSIYYLSFLNCSPLRGLKVSEEFFNSWVFFPYVIRSFCLILRFWVVLYRVPSLSTSYSTTNTNHGIVFHRNREIHGSSILETCKDILGRTKSLSKISLSRSPPEPWYSCSGSP